MSPLVRKVMADTAIATAVYVDMMIAMIQVEQAALATIGHVAHEATCRADHRG